MAGRELSAAEVLAAIPQQPPFRFVDSIDEIDDEHVVARYRYRADEPFFLGHFPGNPLTPGVVLIETIAQGGLVPLAIYLAAKISVAPPRLLPLFTEAQAEFHDLVRPQQGVTVRARKIYFRRRKLCVEATLHREDGTLVCSGRFSGIGLAP